MNTRFAMTRRHPSASSIVRGVVSIALLGLIVALLAYSTQPPPPPNYTLTVNRSGGGDCTVFQINTPEGSWNTPTSEAFQATFAAGTAVEVEADVDSPCGYCPDHWLVNDEEIDEGGSRTLAGFDMNEDTTATAVFVEATVSIDTVNICDDEITVTVAGEDLAGYLLVELVSETSAHTIYNEIESSGTRILSFDWPTVPVGVEYTSIRATWSPCDAITPDSYDAHFMNLGYYRQTQYNMPDESHATCNSSPVDVCFTDNNCDYFTGTLLSTFASEVAENGTGTSINHGVINVEAWCHNQEDENGDPLYPPPPACEGHSIFRENGNPLAASCGGGLGNDTVARRPRHPHLACGDTVCILGVGTKTVTDEGGGLAVAQLDNYTTETACSGITDLVPYPPGAITIKLYDE